MQTRLTLLPARNFQTFSYAQACQAELRSFSPQLRLSAVNVGRVMAKLGFVQERNKNGRFWKVIEIPVGEIGHTVPSDTDLENDTPF